jgi:hypothetical protein
MSAKTGQFDMLSAPRQKAISYQVKLMVKAPLVMAAGNYWKR